MNRVHDTAENAAVRATRERLRRAAASWLTGDDGTALQHVVAALDAYIETIGIDERFWRVLDASARVLEEHGHAAAAAAVRDYFEAVARRASPAAPRDVVWDRMLGVTDVAEWDAAALDRIPEERLILSIAD